MVLQVVAHAWQIQDLLHARFLEPCAGADAGTLQDLWRGDGAAAEDDFAAGKGGAGAGAIDLVAHAHGAGAFEEDDIDHRARLDGERVALAGHVQVAARGGRAPALAGDEAVHGAEAFLLVAVEVIGARVAGLHAGLDHGLEEGVGAGFCRGDLDGAVAAVVVIGTDVAPLGLAEVGQHVVVAPVGQAVLFRPVVEVQRVAADVAHAVDERRAAQTLAPAAVHATVVHVGFGIGLVAPVVGQSLQGVGQRGGHLGAEVEAVVGQAGFEQQNLDVGVLGQAGGQGAAGGTCADDDVIVSACLLLCVCHGVFLRPYRGGREGAPGRRRLLLKGGCDVSAALGPVGWDPVGCRWAIGGMGTGVAAGVCGLSGWVRPGQACVRPLCWPPCVMMGGR